MFGRFSAGWREVPPRDAQSVDRALRAMQQITAFGVAIDGLEQIAARRSCEDDGPLSWRVNRLHVGQQIGPLGLRLLDPIFRYPNWLAVPHIRFLAASALLTGKLGARHRAGLTALLCATATATALRNRLAGDGSDSMSFITMSATAMADLFPADVGVREACLRFVAFQALLSYATSGAVKVVSPEWRSGAALGGVLRTRSFGDIRLHRLLAAHPRLKRALSWAVIVAELCFPLIVFFPPSLARATLLAGATFHVANARFMGLNRFVWAFAGTYPGVAHVTAAAGRPATSAVSA